MLKKQPHFTSNCCSNWLMISWLPLTFHLFFFSPAHSFIIDLSLTSKIKGEFNDKQWTELVGRRPDAVRKIYHHEIEPIISHLFEQKVRIFELESKLGLIVDFFLILGGSITSS